MKVAVCLVVSAILFFTHTEAESLVQKNQTELLNTFLTQHNLYRKKHGVPELELDPELTRQAQEWADELARTNVMKHNPGTANKYGENIYMTSKSDLGKAAVENWYKESQLYTDYSNDPSLTKRQILKNTGHFTQVVWKDTKKVGVATATSSKGKTYVVANYSPPGNVKGKYLTNVLPPNAQDQEDIQLDIH